MRFTLRESFVLIFNSLVGCSLYFLCLRKFLPLNTYNFQWDFVDNVVIVSLSTAVGAGSTKVINLVRSVISHHSVNLAHNKEQEQVCVEIVKLSKSILEDQARFTVISNSEINCHVLCITKEQYWLLRAAAERLVSRMESPGSASPCASCIYVISYWLTLLHEPIRRVRVRVLVAVCRRD